MPYPLLLILGWVPSQAQVFLCTVLLFVHKKTLWCLMCRLVASYSNLHKMHFWIFLSNRSRFQALLSMALIQSGASMDTSWEIIASLTAWHIWKARCTEALDGSQVHPSSTLASIWMDCIHTLMASWASMQGILQATTSKCVYFLREWRGSPFFLSRPLGCLGTSSHNLGYLLLLFEEFL